MGWWAETDGAEELLIGDEPIDAAGEMLERILAAYKEDAERKPKPQELAKTLEIAMRSRIEELFEEMEDKELFSVTVKMRNRPKRQPIRDGDYFAVPLASGGFGYGRVSRVFLTSVLLVEFLDIYSQAALGMEAVRNAPVLFEAICGYLALANWQWRVIGNVPVVRADTGRSTKEDLEAEACRLGVGYGPGSAAKKLEEELRKRLRIR